MKVYISGKITGLPFDEVERNFREAEKRLKEKGFKVVCPLDNGIHPNASWVSHMKADLKMMMDCNTIYLLSNWKRSKGARIERLLAIVLGFHVILQVDNG